MNKNEQLEGYDAHIKYWWREVLFIAFLIFALGWFWGQILFDLLR